MSGEQTHICDGRAMVVWRDGRSRICEITDLSTGDLWSRSVWAVADDRVLSVRCVACGWKPVEPKRVTHLTRVKQEFDLAMIQWETDRERELRGHLHDTPERGETLPLSEQRFRERFPRPVWLDYVKNVGVSGMSHANNHGMVGV